MALDCSELLLSRKNIEQDVVEQILLTLEGGTDLPPKSLMRFKCISKRWYDLITNPRFVAKHLSKSKHNNPSTCVLIKRLVCKDTQTKDTEMAFSLLNFCYDNDGGGLSINLSSVEDLTVPTRVVETLRIIGHCDGIVCLGLIDYNDRLAKCRDVCLWNPAIQGFKLLPQEPFLPDWSKVSSSIMEQVPYLPFHRLKETMGFGYDPKSEDYKVIDIGFSGSYGGPRYHGGHLIIYPPRAVVYTVKTNSWREIKTSSLERETTYLWPESFQIYLRGMCYWLGYEQQKEFLCLYDIIQKECIGQAIISFDTTDEVFHYIPLPYELLEINNSDDYFLLRLSLTVWNESVALFGLNYVDRSPYDAMWIMWVMDAKNVWTKHLTFETVECFPNDFPQKTLAFWKSNEILGVSKNGSIFCYNLTTKNVKYLPIQSIPHCFVATDEPSCYPFWGVAYVNSIVSP